MGSFFAKGHSGTLKDGQETILMFVSKTNINNKFIHGEYQMLSLPIECIYDDCGYFELKESSRQNYDIFEKWLKNNMIELEEGENKSHDIQIKKELIDWKFTQKSIRESRLFVKSNWKEKNTILNIKEEVIRNVEIFAVHKSYFEQVMENYISSNYFGESENFEKYNENILNFFNNCLEFKKEENLLIKSGEYSTTEENFTKRENFEMETRNYRELLDSNYTHVFQPLSSILLTPIYKLETIEKEILNEISKSLYFKIFIESNQFDLIPFRYGNQEDNNKELIQHINFQLNTIKLSYLEDMESFYYIMESNLEIIENYFSKTIDELYKEIENTERTQNELLEDETFNKLIKLCVL